MYVATNILPASLWREVARNVGLHTYSETDVPTCAGCRLVGVDAPRVGASASSAVVRLSYSSSASPNLPPLCLL